MLRRFKMKAKFYFTELDETRCFTLVNIIQDMLEQGSDKLKVWEAIRETGSDYFYCKAFETVGMKGEHYDKCGKECDQYIPRNGKSGLCKFKSHCYEKGNAFILYDSGQLKPI